MQRRDRVALVHHDSFVEYDFGPWHPLRPERITLGLDLLREAGLWAPSVEAIDPKPATAAELETVHHPAYVRAVTDAGTGWLPQSELARFGLGPGDTPAFAGMHEISALIAGGTLGAARAILAGALDHAFNPAGGWHHALRDRASGFCVYNDAAIAAAVLSEEHGIRTLYVDFDCHHGDGVQWIFYDDPSVLTISFHESGRYLFPGTGDVDETGEGAGRGYAINVPFAPSTGNASWLEAIHAVLPVAAERFRPDLIISNHGADTHVLDPLTHLSLTTAAFREQVRLVHQLAHTYTRGRWLAVGSGGYEWRAVVPRSWAIVWSEMAGKQLPARLPDSWLSRWAHLAPEGLPTAYVDAEVAPDAVHREDIARINRAAIERALDVARAPA